MVGVDDIGGCDDWGLMSQDRTVIVHERQNLVHNRPDLWLTLSGCEGDFRDPECGHA